MLYAVGHYFTCEYIMQYICWIKHRCHVFMGIKRFEKIRSEEIGARAGVANKCQWLFVFVDYSTFMHNDFSLFAVSRRWSTCGSLVVVETRRACV